MEQQNQEQQLEQNQEQLEQMDTSTDMVDRNVNSYFYIKVLGQGSFGQVWKARIISTGQIIALKIIDLNKIPVEQKQSYLDLIHEEIDSLEKISFGGCHPFLACYYLHHYDAIENKYLIEMEYIEGDTLDVWRNKFLYEKRNFDLLNQNLLHLLADLSIALNFIHEKRIIHRDIKPGNILITKDGVPKLIDFGLSCMAKNSCAVNQRNCCIGNGGSPFYMAPETISYSNNYFATDIWSLGATIFEMAAGALCFDFSNTKDISSVVKIIVTTLPYKLQTNNTKLNFTVNGCLIHDYRQRITSNQILDVINRQ